MEVEKDLVKLFNTVKSQYFKADKIMSPVEIENFWLVAIDDIFKKIRECGSNIETFFPEESYYSILLYQCSLVGKNLFGDYTNVFDDYIETIELINTAGLSILTGENLERKVYVQEYNIKFQAALLLAFITCFYIGDKFDRIKEDKKEVQRMLTSKQLERLKDVKIGNEKDLVLMRRDENNRISENFIVYKRMENWLSYFKYNPRIKCEDKSTELILIGLYHTIETVYEKDVVIAFTKRISQIMIEMKKSQAEIDAGIAQLQDDGNELGTYYTNENLKKAFSGTTVGRILYLDEECIIEFIEKIENRQIIKLKDVWEIFFPGKYKTLQIKRYLSPFCESKNVAQIALKDFNLAMKNGDEVSVEEESKTFWGNKTKRIVKKKINYNSPEYFEKLKMLESDAEEEYESNIKSWEKQMDEEFDTLSDIKGAFHLFVSIIKNREEINRLG